MERELFVFDYLIKHVFLGLGYIICNKSDLSVRIL